MWSQKQIQKNNLPYSFFQKKRLPTLEPRPSKAILFVLGHVHKWENMKENVYFKSTCS